MKKNLKYSRGKSTQTSFKDKVEWLQLQLAWYRLGVESAELSEIAVDRQVFRVPLGRFFSLRKGDIKMN